MIIKAASNLKTFAVVRIGSSKHPVFIADNAKAAAKMAKWQRDTNKEKHVSCKWEAGSQVRADVDSFRKTLGFCNAGLMLSAWIKGERAQVAV